MENSTYLDILITTISICTIGFGIIYYAMHKNIPQDLPKNLNISPEDLLQNIPPIMERVISHPIPDVPLTNFEINLLMDIYRDDRSIVESLYDFREKYLENSNQIVRDIINSGITNEEELMEEFVTRLTGTDEWCTVVGNLMYSIPRPRLLEAFKNKLLNCAYTYESIETIPEVPLISNEVIGSEIVVVSEPSNIFYDFVSSEFGIKCIVVGSVITVTAIIIHLLVVYYYKTTYTAIAYKCINFISKLLKF